MKQNVNTTALTKEGRSPFYQIRAFFTASNWYLILLSCVLVTSLLLNFFQLGLHDYSNPYYAAAIKSMLTSWHNFFFVSFDPAGFVSIDKPPLGFWLQALSAKIFGFSPWSLLLPQALAGVLSVALLAHLVRRIFGSLAALFAALALALFPISVITNRNNAVDSLLVFVILCAAWSITLAVEKGRLRWLLLSAALVGLGFNIKTLEAYLILPSFALLYLFAAPLRWRTRIFHLLLASLVLLLISFAWIAAVDLTPANERPYVGSSGNNSELNLTLGYNGLVRIFGLTFLSPESAAQGQTSPSMNNIVNPGETGNPGPLRLINNQLGTQVSCLLPLAIIGLIAVGWRSRPQLKSNRQQQSIFLWGTWFLVQAIFFSAIAYFHIYYMVMFAPSICTLAGIALAGLWHDYIQHNWRAWFLPIALLITAAFQIYLLYAFPEENHWLSPLILGLTLLATLTLCIIHLLKQPHLRHIASLALIIGCLTLLLTSTLWATLPIIQGHNTAFPSAGPSPQQNQLTQQLIQYQAAMTHPDPLLITYLVRHQGQTRYLVGTTSAPTAIPFILATGKPAMALGGYNGFDQILTQDQVSALVKHGTIRYFLIFTRSNFINIPLKLRLYFLETAAQTAILNLPNQNDSISWIIGTCNQVQPTEWRTGYVSAEDKMDGNNLLTLFDCQRASQ